jgi:hypothetical protein
MIIEDYINNGMLLYIMESGSRGYYIKVDEDIAQNTVDIGVEKGVKEDDLSVYIHFPNYHNVSVCESNEGILYIYEDKPKSINHLIKIHENYYYPGRKILSVMLR